MKKVYMLGMVLAMAACFAYAASLSVPWFVDSAPAATGLPPGEKVMGIVYLHNNLEDDIVCSIEYYTADGIYLGPEAPDPTTFEIPALSTVGFRPVASDPNTVGGGQETDVAMAIPNRPTIDASWNPNGKAKPNGSLVVKWTTGGANDVQGMVLQTQNVDGTTTGRLMQWGTLLPPGT